MGLSGISTLPLAASWSWATPLWYVAVGAAIAVAGLVGIYYLLNAVLPKIAAIAWATAKEGVSQPLFFFVIGIGSFLLVLFLFLPYNTFGEDIKMVKETGLTLIVVLSIALALWTASVSIAQEIDGRTALTVLSKPIGRRSFVIGKFLGIIGPVAIIFIVLGSLFLCTVSYKMVYDAVESSSSEPTSLECYNAMMQITPGLVLAFFKAIVLSSISVAISTRLSMIPNLIICGSVYVLGHLVPMVVNSAQGAHGIVPFVGQFLATILPVLDHFNVESAIARDAVIPWSYVAWTGLYALLYSTVAMLVALLLFEDRDLA